MMMMMMMIDPSFNRVFDWSSCVTDGPIAYSTLERIMQLRAKKKKCANAQQS